MSASRCQSHLIQRCQYHSSVSPHAMFLHKSSSPVSLPRSLNRPPYLPQTPLRVSPRASVRPQTTRGEPNKIGGHPSFLFFARCRSRYYVCFNPSPRARAPKSVLWTFFKKTQKLRLGCVAETSGAQQQCGQLINFEAVTASRHFGKCQ